MKLGIREGVFVLLLLAIPLMAWWIIFQPQNARDRAMLVQIETKRARVAELNKTTATIGDIETEIAGMEKGIALLESKLPSEKEIDKVLEEITRLAEGNRLVTKSVRVKERNDDLGFAPAGAPFAEQTILIKLEGNFRGFYAFLLALEAQNRIMRVRTMNVQNLVRGSDIGIAAELETSVFFERT